jgi:hypothetical protein
MHLNTSESNIRSVTLSNSVFSVSPSPHTDGSEEQVVIHDTLNELLELVLAVPKLHRMNTLLKEHEWEEGQEDEKDESFRAVSTFEQILYPTMAKLREIYFPRQSGNGLLLTMLR